MTTTAALRRSKDRKVTNSVTPGGAPRIANALGLPGMVTCPGRTPTCTRDCYAVNLEKIYRGVSAVLEGNLKALLEAGTVDGMAALLAAMVDSFLADCDRVERRTGTAVDRVFRIHWDGDFFSLDYAAAWRRVIADRPEVTFWCYTRSFDPSKLDVLPVLEGLPNLKLYLSADRDNVTAAAAARRRAPWTLWAYLADTFQAGRDALSGSRAYACPENGGRIPLISDRGSACARCGVCIEGRGDVVFSVSKR